MGNTADKKIITIEPVTRLEGEAKISIHLNDDGNVENAYFQTVELRGFEKFCQGRPVEEMPRIVTRVCGVCPGPHHTASGKAVDAVYNVAIPPAARMIREVFYLAHILHSHIAHFYVLAGPDFVVGPDADPTTRNILGVIEKLGLDIGKEVIKHRGFSQRIQEIIAGKATHGVCNLPGGVSKPLTAEHRAEIEHMARSLLEFCKFSITLADDVLINNHRNRELILNDTYAHKTYYAGTVDENNHVNFYDGTVRVVTPEGKEYVRFSPGDYLDHIAEHVEPWSYLKFPYLKNVGWNGFTEGVESGIYRVNSLARLNAADGLATPLAHEAYEKMYDALGGKPSHYTLAFNYARVVEMMHAAERLVELAGDKEILDDNVRTIPTATPSEGVGSVEAPRGTLYHHYWTDENGMVEKVNLLVATGQNNGPMNLSIAKAAGNLIKNFDVKQGLLNMVEMAFRAYDPCLACATHMLPGRMPLEVTIFDSRKNLFKTLKR